MTDLHKITKKSLQDYQTKQWKGKKYSKKLYKRLIRTIAEDIRENGTDIPTTLKLLRAIILSLESNVPYTGQGVIGMVPKNYMEDLGDYFYLAPPSVGKND
jgi:hypothetical protein